MKLLRHLFVAVIFTLFVPISLLAWGRKGHSLVAELAFKNLSPGTQKQVLKYLDGLSIEDAASWMDNQRNDRSFDYLKPFHYVNIEKGEQYDKFSSGNIISEINRILSDFDKINTLSDEAIKLNLHEIIHLVGDLHQPFHVGYGTDKGGNKFQVQFEGHGSNLHKVWDSEIINEKEISLRDIEGFARVEKSTSLDVYKWLNESRSYLDNLYPSTALVDEKYINDNAIIIKKQLASAGIRLSIILEKYFANFHREPQFKKEEAKVVLINVDNANDYIGQTVRVCTKVYSTKELSSITFLNCGAAYPNSPLTVVVFKDDLPNFKNNPAQYYAEKSVCITGKLELYKGKPEIILKSESQIEIQ